MTDGGKRRIRPSTDHHGICKGHVVEVGKFKKQKGEQLCCGWTIESEGQEHQEVSKNFKHETV